MNMENKTTIKLELYIINLQGLKYKTRLEKLLFSQPQRDGGLNKVLQKQLIKNQTAQGVKFKSFLMFWNPFSAKAES